MLSIDGAIGEGGGQVLRTALAVSLVTGQPFQIRNIRAGRARPGLQPQHLAAVNAAARISAAQLAGNVAGSRELMFQPGPVQPGEYQFAVGTAGSATLVLQTILPALALAPAPSSVLLEGGTHNPLAPPFEFLQRAYLPLFCRTGPLVEAELHRHGFYPGGGGRMRVVIRPARKLAGFDLPSRGGLLQCRATALLANLPRHIAQRELAVLQRELSLQPGQCELREVEAHGPGNVVLVEVQSECVTEVFCAFGERGVRAEQVAGRAAQQARRYLESPVAVGEHLADQLLLVLALAGGGSFSTLALSAHATTNIEVLKLFLPLAVETQPFDGGLLVQLRCG